LSLTSASSRWAASGCDTLGEGQETDNNYHACLASPKLSAFDGEFDPAWPVVRLLVALRLAEVLGKADGS
jgi:fatty-acid desaturase